MTNPIPHYAAHALRTLTDITSTMQRVVDGLEDSPEGATTLSAAELAALDTRLWAIRDRLHDTLGDLYELLRATHLARGSAPPDYHRWTSDLDLPAHIQCEQRKTDAQRLRVWLAPRLPALSPRIRTALTFWLERTIEGLQQPSVPALDVALTPETFRAQLLQADGGWVQEIPQIGAAAIQELRHIVEHRPT